MAIYLNMKQYTKSKNKYKNKECTFNGIKFQSLREKNHYIKLSMMQNLGKISALKLQQKFELQPGFDFKGKKIRPIYYIADFTYIQDDKLHIVDVKSEATRNDKVYKLKKKMMMYKGYAIEEV